MKHICISIILLLSVFTMSSKSYSQDDFTVLEDRYFGQKPPGLIPKLFAPDIVSPKGSFEGGKFSPDMKTFYFHSKNAKYEKYERRTFFVIRYENNSWGNESETYIQYPGYSRDGNIMYHGNKYRERIDTGWSLKKSLGAPFKDIPIMGLSVSSKGTYYFDFMEGEGNGYIRYSRLIGGKREKPQKMSKALNMGKWTAHPFIAPDESYLLWDVEADSGYGRSEIYISFRAKDGSWLPAMNMGDKINTELHESSPHVSPDGKYLFFSRSEEKVRADGSTYRVVNPYWVDTQVIDNLRPKP